MSQQSAEVLKHFMHIHSVSVAEFARAVDVSRFSIYRYLKGAKIQPKVARRMEENILKNYRVFLPHEKLID